MSRRHVTQKGLKVAGAASRARSAARAAGTKWVDCSHCGATVTAQSLEKHVAERHPKHNARFEGHVYGIDPTTVRDVRHAGRVILWTGGERNRTLTVRRPCSCGCDGSTHGVGYLSISDEFAHGLTIWLRTEAEYQAARAIYGGEP